MQVVAGVRKVWKLKVKGAIKKAVTKAALQVCVTYMVACMLSFNAHRVALAPS